jgi:endonuclease/exonuclease/phosphatase (EEP) superfamily protein YafD
MGRLSALGRHGVPKRYKSALPPSHSMSNDPVRPARRTLLAARLLWGVALGASLACLLGLLGDRHWLLDLFAHWRVQYAVALVVSAIGLLALRRWFGAALALLAAVPISATVIDRTGGQLATAHAAAPAFRFVTFNQFAGNRNAPALGQWLEHSQADVVAIQELSSPQAVQALAAVLPSYPHVHAQFGRWADVTLFSRWPILAAQSVELVPGGAQAAKLRIAWRGRPVSVVGVHLHWPIGAANVRFRNAELLALAELARVIHEPLLIGGDFNITQWSPVFDAAFAASPLQDCSRGQGLVNSWPSFFPPAAIRIDHCLASRDWRVLKLWAGPSLGSDHLPMVNELTLVR